MTSTDVRFVTRLLPWLLIAGGGIGLVAAFVLTVEKLALLKDSDYIPTCSINPVLSCGSIMKPEQAEVFGFPNPLLGIAGFAAVGTIGVVLVTGAALPRWCWLGLQAGVTFGVGFVHWLIYQSLYVIGALCPYCMAVWAVMIPIFWYTTLHNLEQGHLPSPRRTTTALASYHSVALILWYLLIAGAVLQAFWFYWTTLVE